MKRKSNLEDVASKLEGYVSEDSAIPVTKEDIKALKEGKVPNSLKNAYKDEKVDLKNYMDLQYYGPLKVGSAGKEFTLVYDTGSSWLWIPNQNCSGCPTRNTFDSEGSTTYQTEGVRKTLSYGKGQVEGIIATDNVFMSNSTPSNMNFVNVDRGTDLSGQQADGIVGLTPESTDEGRLLVDVIFESGLIDKPEFLVYIGKEGVDSSYIEFGEFKGNMTNGTVLEVQPYNSSGIYIYWNITNQGVFYEGLEIELSTVDTVWDTGTSILGFPTMDLMTILEVIAGNRETKYYIDVGFFGFGCKGVEDNIQELQFKFGDKNVTVSPYEFIQYIRGVCLFFVFDMGAQDFMLLGDSFLRGSKILHDQENKKVVLFEQKIYDYKNSGGSSSLLWLWVLLGCAGALIIGIALFCVWRSKSRSRNYDYARVQDHNNYP